MKNGFDKDALNFHNKTFTSTKKDFPKSRKNTARAYNKTSLDLL